DLLRGEQPVALVSGEDLHLGGLALAVGGHAPTLAPGGGPVIPPEGRAGTDGSPGRARANGPRWRGGGRYRPSRWSATVGADERREPDEHGCRPEDGHRRGGRVGSRA